MNRPPRRQRRAAFTLVELLIVVGIIAVLVGLLMPAAMRARANARMTVCHNNLRQIGTAMRAFALDHDDTFPTADQVGDFAYRMRPGNKTENDPGALPETYGMAAVLHGIRPQQPLSGGLPPAKYMAADGGAWVCPAAQEYFLKFGNTYAFMTKTLKLGSPLLSTAPVVWDNDTLKPYLSGFRGGSTQGYVIPLAQRIYPHQFTGKGGNGTIVELYADGHAGTRDKTN